MSWDPRHGNCSPAQWSQVCAGSGDEGGGAGTRCPCLAEPTLCHCPDNLLSPTHLDWDMLVEPSYLFSASPAPEPGQPSLGDASAPLRCQVVIHALRAGKPVSWEVTGSLESLLQPREGPGREDPPRRVAKAWDKPLHRLAARSVVRDNESVAQREAKLEQGGCRCLSPARLRHPPRSDRAAPGRFCSPVPPESRANQQSLQRALPLHSPGARGLCHAGSPARSPRGVGHRYGQGPGGMGRWQQGDRGLRWHRPLQLAQPAGHELLQQGTGTTGAPHRVRGSSRM